MRLVSYNVHRCIGVDGQGSVERIAEVLGELAPDVVALQEVVSSARIPQPGQLERLADAAGLEPVAGGTLADGEGLYGNGLLLRTPPLEIVRHDLSLPGVEPRGALEVVTEVFGRPVRVVATHLGLRRRERRRQVGQLREILAARPEPVLALLGDVNEWRPRVLGDPTVRLSATLRPVPVGRTFPSRRPVVGLDRIWIDPELPLRASGSHRSPLARVASDHLPAWAELAKSDEGDGSIR